MTKLELTPEESITLASYNIIAPQWAEAHKDPRFWQAELTTFKKYLPSGKVLEIGCGGGRDAEALAALGYEYIGTDISVGLLDVARTRNPNLAFYQQSVHELDFPNNYFDGFWCSATLLHIPRSRIDEALIKIHQVIQPAGIGFISIKHGLGEEILEEEEFEYKFKRYFVYYSEDEFSEILKRNSYGILEVQDRPMSKKTTWLNFFVNLLC